MNRPLARGVRLILALILLGGLAALGAGGTRAYAEETAADRYVACLNGSKKGDLLILVDSSASLKTSDQANARVTAGEYLLRRLARSAEDGKLQLNVSLAGFANRYEPGNGQWDQLNPGSVNKVVGDIKTFAQRNDGRGTDYWLGLDGARRALTDRKNAAPDSCQAVVFFSDGSLDIDRAPDEDRNPIARPYDPDNKLRNAADRERAKRAAADDLCRPGGLADQLRTPPITIFGVGLTAGGSQASDFDLMKRVVVGGGGCGAQPPVGAFALASDIDSLLQAFDRIAGEGTQQEGRYCQGGQAQACDEGAHDFVLDQSISSVAVLGSGDIEEPRIVLIAPNDKQVELKHGAAGQQQTADLDGVKLTWTWMSKKSFSVDLGQGNRPESWTGRWRVVFFDPKGSNPQARSRTNVHISGNVFPTWPNATKATVRAGEASQVTFGLENAQRQPIDATKLLGTATMDAVLTDSTGGETPIATGLTKDRIATPQKLDASKLKPGPAKVRLALKVKTASWTNPRTQQVVQGTDLKPQLAEIGFTVAAPAGFGKVADRVNFGAVEGPVNLNGSLQVTGPGCVWLDPAKPPTVTTGPKEISQVSITSSATDAASCLKVAEGATAELPLNLASPQIGTGGLSGTFGVQMSSLDAPDKVQDFTVGYGAEVARPLNRTNFALTLIAALILGPGIPLLLLYAAKFVSAKIPGRPLLTQQLPVQVAGSQLLRDGAPLAWRRGDLTQMAQISSKGARSVDLGGITLQARTGGSPFGSGHVVVEAPGQVGASSAYTEPSGKQHQARLPLAVHQNWVLLHDPNGPADRATALLLVGGATTERQREELLEDLGRRGSQVFQGLRSHNRSAAAGPQQPGSPFGGQPGPGGPGQPEPSPFGGGGAQQFPQQQSGPQQPQQQFPHQQQPQQPPHQQQPPQPNNPFGQNPFA
ncbi:VWA domain-containing protein [Naumannella sp. ID2617S]|nr:VWA domain-containing protein [Naumannella sp. ID2617S]